MDSKNISRGSLQQKRPKSHSLSILLKLLAFLWAGQKVVWGERGFCLILSIFLIWSCCLSFHIPAFKQDLTLQMGGATNNSCSVLFSSSRLYIVSCYLNKETKTNQNMITSLFSGKFHPFWISNY